MTRAESLKADLRVIQRGVDRMEAEGQLSCEQGVRALAELVRDLVEMLEEKDLLA